MNILKKYTSDQNTWHPNDLPIRLLMYSANMEVMPIRKTI